MDSEHEGEPKRFETSLFFLLAFLITWSVWGLAAAASHEMIGWQPSPTLTRLLGAFGPTLAALILTIAIRGGAGLKRLLGRFLVWRVGVQWYAFVLLAPAVIQLASVATCALFGRPMPDFARPPIMDAGVLPPDALAAGPWVLLPALFIQQLLTSSPMGEEIGWRGYALPRLQHGRSAVFAAVAIGLLWGLWHVPLHFIKGDPLAQASLAWMIVGPVVDSILFAWVFNNTKGSLLLALLFHAALNMTGLYLPPAPIPVVAFVLKLALALTVIGLFGAERLTRNLPAPRADQPLESSP